MTPDELAALHLRAMSHTAPWSAKAFADTLAQPSVFLRRLRDPEPRGLEDESGTARPLTGFVIGRAAASEAELLTLVVDPNAQRRGLGRRLLTAFETEAVQRQATTAYLEVSEDNAPALALYVSAGWSDVGRRPDYYRRDGHPPSSAIVMAKPLSD